MPTFLGEPYSPLWRGKYPHMLPEDYPVWESFLNLNPTLFERIYYDVAVGGILPADKTLPEPLRWSYFKSTAKRIDAIGELKNEIWIIEVANTPGLRATGQLLTYMALWFEDPKIQKPAFGTLIASVVDSDLRKALELYGMRVRVRDTG